MKAKKRKHLTFSEVNQETWIECRIADSSFGSAYVEMLDWTNKNTNGFHSRSTESFWFEDPKDAFKFKLRWGTGNG